MNLESKQDSLIQ